MERSHRKTAALAGLALLLVLAGCAQVTVHSEVKATGEVAELTYQINMSRTTYGYLEESAEAEGYDSVKESMLADFNESEREDIEVTEEFNGDQVTLTMTREDFVPDGNSSINVTTADGKLTYEDTTFVNETAASIDDSDDFSDSLSGGFTVDYYLTMPGEITNSNADTVDGNTAEWHESGSEAFTDNRIYAVSKKPTIGSVPGFEAVGAVIALLVATLLLARRE
ncbi:PGF-CTERM sorting domain-containing protein [Haloferax sp. S1W]|uniref:PGF-CTERM sorting domain-containing protein n=1 Tax=Haloferax sp. S1W TaxID=3377110 RepID=UPI0037CC1AF5